MAGEASSRSASAEQYRRWTAVALAASVAFTAIAAAILAMIGNKPRAGSWETIDQVLIWDGMMVMATLIAVLVARRQPSNPLGWWLASGGAVGSFATTTDEYAAWTLQASPGVAPGGTVSLLASSVALFVSWALLGAHMTLRFPTGYLLSRRWRWIAHLATASAFLCAIEIFHPEAFDDAEIFVDLPGVSNPIGFEAARDVALVAFGLGILGLFAATFIAVGSLVVRYHRARGIERVQVRWVAFAALAVTVTALVSANLANAVDDPARGVLLAVSSTVPLSLMAAVGVALVRHNLFDLNLVIRRAVLSTLLVAFISLAYVVTAVTVGATLGTGNDTELPVSIIATAVVAFAFQPARRRFEAIANRLVYGDVVAPYELMAGLSRRMSATVSAEDALGEVARAVGRGLRAAAARVRLSVPDGVREAVWLADDALTSPGEYALARDVTHAGEKVGEVEVAVRRDDPPGTSDLRVLDDLVSHAGVTLHNLQLTAELERRLEELRASRQRLVQAQSEERRRMERDIHDGAQQQLVALQIKLGLARHALEASPEQMEPTFAELQSDAREALETLRDLARGLFPPTLVERGLAPALQAHADKVALPVSIVAEGLGAARFDTTIEAAVYFCIREALQNASKHAPGANLVVRLEFDGEHLRFVVADDGPGFDPTTVKRGSGLQNMVDRIEALDGALTFESTPGKGTQVIGRLPVTARAADRERAPSLSIDTQGAPA